MCYQEHDVDVMRPMMHSGLQVCRRYQLIKSSIEQHGQFVGYIAMNCNCCFFVFVYVLLHDTFISMLFLYLIRVSHPIVLSAARLTKWNLLLRYWIDVVSFYFLLSYVHDLAQLSGRRNFLEPDFRGYGLFGNFSSEFKASTAVMDPQI